MQGSATTASWLAQLPVDCTCLHLSSVLPSHLKGFPPCGGGRFGSKCFFSFERGFDALSAVKLRFEFACIALKYECQMIRDHPCPG